MKLNNAIYVSDKERVAFVKELNLTLNIIHQCSSLVVRKDDADYILKDRWEDPFISKEENIKTLSNKDFLIVSRQLLMRINGYCRHGEVIYPGDNLIIQM